MLRRTRSLGLAAALVTLLAAPALAGPPWISIEIQGGPARAGAASSVTSAAARPRERVRRNMGRLLRSGYWSDAGEPPRFGKGGGAACCAPTRASGSSATGH